MLSWSGVTFEQWTSLNNKRFWSGIILDLCLLIFGHPWTWVILELWSSLNFGHPWFLVILDLWSSLIFDHPWSLVILDLWSSLIFGQPWSLVILDLWSSLIYLQYILDLWTSLIFEPTWSLKTHDHWTSSMFLILDQKKVFHDITLIYVSIFSWERSTQRPTKYCQE